jgi:hypothetical protein
MTTLKPRRRVAPTTVGPEGLLVQRSPLQQRLDKLIKDHDRLLRDIRKKQAQLSLAHGLVVEVSDRLLIELTPLRHRFGVLLREIQSSFDGLLAPDSRLNRRDKVKVRRVYMEICEDLGLDELAPRQPDESPTASSDGSSSGGRSGARPGKQRGGDHSSYDRTSSANDGSDGFGQGTLGGYSANKPSENKASTLRALFRRLAIAFHPDKVQDENDKQSRTTLMKDVTTAYESGDLARLMELERRHLAQLPFDDDVESQNRREKDLTVANSELRRQAKAVADEFKDLCNGLPFHVDLKASNARDRALMELDRFIKSCREEEVAVTRVRDFVRAFVTGQMSAAAFEAGPVWSPLAPNDRGSAHAPPSPRTEDDIASVLEAFAAELNRNRERKSRPDVYNAPAPSDHSANRRGAGKSRRR